MHNSYVVQLTTKLFKGQCHHLIDNDCVAIGFPDFPLYLHIKKVRLCTQKGIWATRFSLLNEQKLLVGVVPKIEANLKHLKDLIDFFPFFIKFGENQSTQSCWKVWLRSAEIKESMKFIITTSYQKMFLYFYPALYSQRELMPTLIVFHSEHRHSKLTFQVQISQQVARFALLKKFKI
jgi:hypothetical protein